MLTVEHFQPKIKDFLVFMKEIAFMDVAFAGDLLTRKICVLSINGYQKYLSPRKGYSCAYRVLNGENSCSQAVKSYIQQFGVMKAIPLIQKQFQDCQASSKILKKSRVYSFDGNLSTQVTRACVIEPDDILFGMECCAACAEDANNNRRR